MNLRSRFPLFLLFLLFSTGMQAQLEAAIWYFGENAGLDFRSGTPVALDDGQLDTVEGCATISDATGNLLFYTEGIQVWNKNHELMPNGTGLLGHSSSTQSAIIVPKPNDPNIYYIFTCWISNGLHYSEVDMTLDGGLGDVVNKNVPLMLPDSSEKLTAVNHANGTDVWVITHGVGNNQYLAYRITPTGVVTSPVVSNVGLDLSAIPYPVGYLKASPDGTRLAACHKRVGAELLDFDNVTGMVSNPIVLSKDTLLVYGTEFSPSGQVLYIAEERGSIYQYDLNAPDIPSSIITISDANERAGALQLGIDGKIYSTIFINTKLSVINYPNVVGPGCQYEYGAIDLGDNMAYFGLPPFIQSYFYIGDIQAQNLCFGQSTEFYLNIGNPILSILWDFGDGTTSTDEEPMHTYAVPGTYMVNVTVTTASGSDVKTQEIVISEIPMAETVPNVEVCHDAETYEFDLSTMDGAVLGSQDPSEFSVAYFTNQPDADNNTNGLTSPTSLGRGTTTIFARISNEKNLGCFDTTSFDVIIKEAPELHVPKDWVVCDDDGDGQHTFDLTSKDTEILNGQDPTLFTVSYHNTQTDADNGINAIGPNYTVTVSADPIFFRIENTAYPECFQTGSFIVGVIDQVMAHTPGDLVVCDDNNDGSAIFDLTAIEAEVLGAQSANSVTITYHVSQADADSNSNPLPTVYASSSYQQTIFIRASNALDGSCYTTTSYQLNIFDTPVIPTVSDWVVCDDDNDGQYVFYLNEKAGEIIGGTTGVSVSFYGSEQDAELEQNVILDAYNNLTSPQTIYFRLENSNNPNCFSVGSFALQVLDTPTAYRPTDIVICDDAGIGSYQFNLSQKDGEVLNGQDPTVYEVAYYATELDALSADSPLSKDNYANTAYNEIIYVRVQHTQLTSCYDIANFNVIVNPLPHPDLEETYVICPDSPELVIDAGTFETYSWKGPSGNIVGNQMTMDVTELGNYELTVTEMRNGVACSNSVSFEVVSSGAPDSFTIRTDGFSDRVTVTVDAIGIGNFEYSMDGLTFGTSNQFEVFPGQYTVYVRDPFGCRTLEKDIVVVGYQKFFTPNGDGINDYWNIVEGLHFTDSQLFIYDRLGKLLIQIYPDGKGWDGTYRGKPMPSSDYWFRYEYDQGKVQTGHFSLKR